MNPISVAQANAIVQRHTRDFGTERIPLVSSLGRVLRESWHSDRDMPPYDRVTMDGIAFNYERVQGKYELDIENVVAAGDPQYNMVNTSSCVEIMTGAVLPHDTDTVVRYEDIIIQDKRAHIQSSYRKHQNIHHRGSDHARGSLLIDSHTMIGASEIGVGASIGKSIISVSRLPKTVIIATGDELVAIEDTPLTHQIRQSNVYQIASILTSMGVSSDIRHLTDHPEQLHSRLETLVKEYDLVILSGGVSKGKFDFLPEILEKCGVQKHFHIVAQRPGKPLWFGTHPHGTTVFALPGNPVSSFMCCVVYVMDWLRGSLGLPGRAQPYATLAEVIDFKPSLTYFVPVKISYSSAGRLMAHPTLGNGSGDLANLLRGDAFICLPSDLTTFEPGQAYPLYPYR